MSDDTAVALLGPHAVARIESRMQALKSFGVDPHALVKIEQTRSLAQQSRKTRELTLQGEHDLVSF